ncbi:MAG: hypothetical protein ACOYEV_16300 [Candidatus Nanopelagicales bacterium]
MNLLASSSGAGHGTPRGPRRPVPTGDQSEAVLRDWYQTRAADAVVQAGQAPTVGQLRPTEADIRDSVAVLAAYDATILWGPGVYDQGGMIRGARTPFANRERRSTIQGWAASEQALHEAAQRLRDPLTTHGLICDLQQLIYERRALRARIEKAQAQAKEPADAAALLLIREALAAVRAGEADAAVASLEAVRGLMARVGFNAELVAQARRALDSNRVTPIHAGVAAISSGLKRGPAGVPDGLGDLLGTAEEALKVPSETGLVSALTACRGASDLLSTQREGMPPAVREIFYWRLHALLTSLPATRDMDWLSEHFDWKQPAAQHRRIKGHLQGKVRRCALARVHRYADRFTTPGHRYIDVVWAREGDD